MHDKKEWFRGAKFGMFVHWGLYSVLKRGEWVMKLDGIPTSDYEKLAEHFLPEPGFADEWAQLAVRAGMRYAVLTTKHHDGYCLFKTDTTDYNATVGGPRRDLVAEYVQAFRQAGLKVGLYFSLGDWHFPAYKAVAEGARERTDELRTFMHTQVRELMTNYGKIDLLWYDGAWFDGEYLSAGILDSAGLNAMARELQPDILINERAGTTEDFVTCENECKPAPFGTDWEMCTCMNDLWGYAEHDYNYKTINQLIFLLTNCAVQGGNLLLNVSPMANGAVPPMQRELLTAMGNWLSVHGDAIHGVERLQRPFFGGGRITRREGKLYLHTFYWPGSSLRLPDLTADLLGAQPGKAAVKARVLTNGQKAATRWDGKVLIVDELPPLPPDRANTVIELSI